MTGANETAIIDAAFCTATWPSIRANLPYEITGALLHGSVAEGRATPHSDVDILVMTDNASPADRGIVLTEAGATFHVVAYKPLELWSAVDNYQSEISRVIFDTALLAGRIASGVILEAGTDELGQVVQACRELRSSDLPYWRFVLLAESLYFDATGFRMTGDRDSAILTARLAVRAGLTGCLLRLGRIRLGLKWQHADVTTAGLLTGGSLSRYRMVMGLSEVTPDVDEVLRSAKLLVLAIRDFVRADTRSHLD